MKRRMIFLLMVLVSANQLQAQHVGIGTTTPVATLHVTDSLSGVSQAIKLQANQPYIGFYSLNNTYNGYLWENGNGMELGTANSGPVTIAPGFGAAATFLSGGLVGIGTSSPARRLHIKGSGELLRIQGALPFIGFMNDTDANYKGFIYYPDTALIIGSAAGSNQTILLAPNNVGLLFANGQQRVGIGTAAPEEKLQVNGNVKADAFKFTTARTSYYSIGTPDFTARDGEETISRELGAGFASFDVNATGLGMVAPIHLPHGSRITAIQIVGRDASTTSNLQVAIVSRPYSTLSTTTWVTQTSSGSPGNFAIDHTLGSPVPIENDLSYYILQVSGTAGWNASQLGIYGVRLTYTVDEPF